MTEATARSSVEESRHDITRHERPYFVEAAPEIADRDHDRPVGELGELEGEFPSLDDPNSPTHRVGGAPLRGFRSVPHPSPDG